MRLSERTKPNLVPLVRSVRDWSVRRPGTTSGATARAVSLRDARLGRHSRPQTLGLTTGPSRHGTRQQDRVECDRPNGSRRHTTRRLIWCFWSRQTATTNDSRESTEIAGAVITSAATTPSALRRRVADPPPSVTNRRRGERRGLLEEHVRLGDDAEESSVLADNGERADAAPAHQTDHLVEGGPRSMQ